MVTKQEIDDAKQALQTPPGIRTPEQVAQILVLLESSKFFQSQSENLREKLAQMVRSASFSAGSTIFHQGEKGDMLFLLIKGSVCILLEPKDHGKGSEPLHIADIKEGEVFGELSLQSENRVRAATARAITDSTTLIVTRDQYNEVLKGKSVESLNEDMLTLRSIQATCSKDSSHRAEHELRKLMALATNVKFFDNVPRDRLRSIFKHVKHKKKSAGDVLNKYGQTVDVFHIIVSGAVGAFDDSGERVFSIGIGEGFGESALDPSYETRDKYQYQCLLDTQFMTLDQESFEAVVGTISAQADSICVKPLSSNLQDRIAKMFARRSSDNLDIERTNVKWRRKSVVASPDDMPGITSSPEPHHHHHHHHHHSHHSTLPDQVVEVEQEEYMQQPSHTPQLLQELKEEHDTLEKAELELESLKQQKESLMATIELLKQQVELHKNLSVGVQMNGDTQKMNELEEQNIALAQQLNESKTEHHQMMQQLFEELDALKSKKCNVCASLRGELEELRKQVEQSNATDALNMALQTEVSELRRELSAARSALLAEQQEKQPMSSEDCSKCKESDFTIRSGNMELEFLKKEVESLKEANQKLAEANSSNSNGNCPHCASLSEQLMSNMKELTAMVQLVSSQQKPESSPSAPQQRKQETAAPKASSAASSPAATASRMVPMDTLMTLLKKVLTSRDGEINLNDYAHASTIANGNNCNTAAATTPKAKKALSPPFSTPRTHASPSRQKQRYTSPSPRHCHQSSPNGTAASSIPIVSHELVASSAMPAISPMELDKVSKLSLAMSPERWNRKKPHFMGMDLEPLKSGGFRIIRLNPNTFATECKQIQVGDRLITINTKPITSSRPSQLALHIARKQSDFLDFGFLRPPHLQTLVTIRVLKKYLPSFEDAFELDAWENSLDSSSSTTNNPNTLRQSPGSPLSADPSLSFFSRQSPKCGSVRPTSAK